jgi:serine/threonine protein kinase
MMPWSKLDPSWLPPGTRVGPWKVKAFHGGGTFGAVFRAVLAGREHGGPVALKVAYHPWDPRFQREAELLARIQHPSVPRLLGRGEWRHPEGAVYPYLAMEWVEGVPLYEWAVRVRPSSQEMLWVLARVARALEATHAVGGVHRDVKGDHIQARRITAAPRPGSSSSTSPGIRPRPTRLSRRMTCLRWESAHTDA